MFRALRVSQAADSPKPKVRVDLVDNFEDDALGGEDAGDVLVDVEYSSINFKDGLALTGRPGVIKAPNLIPGIDLVGTVTQPSGTWAVGDSVILNGFGIGETHHGGLGERARVKSEWLVRRPESISPARAAAIGTAGFTAMLSVLALERHGLTPDADKPVLVTGASGGVGSIAIALLAGLGHTVTASTGRAAEHDYLRGLGATAIIERAELGEEPGKPMQSQRWGAVIDSVGSTTLANALAQVHYGGVVAACGLAQGPDLRTTVMPFILRSVTLAGINSVQAPLALREDAWARLATDLDLDLLDSLTETASLGEATTVAERIMSGGVRGRTVIDVTR
ncbi:oxidoreductase [Glaciihabitans arcticus]|uniref:Oxidoreductase n=1 Tax=Glaciihabitans arcticus TaxID=2668039 RepID=A0A4V2JF60_9MICO|nr:MDR family oxidoreductase [Glaciihabitans arcticus]TBN58209.1 oxidoreductase [Glaciihabitans arcticus]